MALVTKTSSLSSIEEKQILLDDTQAESSLLDLYPEYQSTSRLDTLRETEYSFLDKQDHMYVVFQICNLQSQDVPNSHQNTC